MTETCATAINPEIMDLISSNKVATICCSLNNKPYCFSCFYAVLEREGCIVFKSSENTRHIQVLSENNQVAGTIVPSETSMTKIQGIQFEGLFVEKEIFGLKSAKSYYSRFPFAVAVPGKVWIIELDAIKYTNTSNGIKHKLDWLRQ